MKCDSRVSLLARTFISLYLGREPKVRVATLKFIIITNVAETITISNKINVAIVSFIHILNEISVVLIIDVDVIAKFLVRAEKVNTSNVIIRRKMSIFEFNL
jgi:hypothetical protein